MKKIFLIAVTALSLASCNGTKADQSTETTEVSGPETTEVRYAPVATDGKVIELDDAAMLAPEVKVKQLTVVDFNAVWCGPCRQLTPVLEDMAAKFQGKVTFISVDVDEYGDLFKAYNMGESIPAVLFLKPDGSSFKMIGTGDLLPAEKFEELINKNL